MRPGDRTSDASHPDFAKAQDLRDLLASQEQDLIDHARRYGTERGVLIDPTGAPTVLRVYGGTADQLTIPPLDEADADLFDGRILTHSHVGAEPLSVDDVLFAITHDLAELRAVGVEHTFSIRPRLGAWPWEAAEDLANALFDLYEEAGRADNRRNGAARRSQAMLLPWREDLHRAVAGVSERFRFAYTRVEAPGEPPTY
jgi:hypothetical protein